MPEKPSEPALTNRAYWDRTSDEYQQRHREFIGRPEPRWGVWQIAESELNVLGDVAGKDVLELGCGAAQWSILLAKQGARPVGLDNSERQLEHARERLAEAGDHGAFTFADPCKLVPEAARLLRRDGLLAFSHSSPFVAVCEGEDERVHSTLTRDYFGLHEQDYGDVVTYELPYGEWIRLFRSNGFVVEDLIEPRPARDAKSTYWGDDEREWARRWPSESIWKARKAE